MSDEFVTLMYGIEWEEGDPFPQHGSDDDFGRPPGEPDDDDEDDEDDDEEELRRGLELRKRLKFPRL